MELRRKSKAEWFRYMMLHRSEFYDMGYTAVYVNGNNFLMFWKCVQGEEGPWLSSRKK
jgi:hypothetical protein